MRYPLSQPTLGPAESRYALDAVNDGWISGTGPHIQRFEHALQNVTHRTYAVATSSGTAALEVVLQALDVGPGDEVIVPALTFAAPASAVVQIGATPVLCDVTEADWTVDVEVARRLISPRTKALIAVDLMGNPCDFAALETLGVPIIEDAAQAHGSSRDGRSCGSFGVASIFSFHANKAVTCGEGGAVVTDDAELAQTCRTIANHGMNPARPYFHSRYGRNARLNNVSAAVGLAQVERWEELVSGRRRAWDRYRSYVDRIHDVVARPVSAESDPACWLAAISTDDVGVLVAGARDREVDARRIWPALSTLPIYARFAPLPCPVAERTSRRTAWLPTWSHMTEDEVAAVVRAVWPTTNA